MAVFQPTRSQEALGALSRGRLGEAASVLVGRPTSAAPVTLADRFFGPADSFAKKAFNVITDPFVLFGLALHLKFPVVPADQVFTFSDKVARAGRTFIPGLNRLSSFQNKFRGEPVGRTFEEILSRNIQFKTNYATRVGETIARWESATGKPWDTMQQIRFGLALEGADRPGNAMWRAFRGRAVAPSLVRPGGLNLGDADKAFIAEIRGVQRDTFQTVIETAKKNGTLDASFMKQEFRAQGFAAGSMNDIEELKDFFPHIQSRGSSVERDINRIITAAQTDAQVARRATIANAENALAPGAKLRRNQMIPDLNDLELVQDSLAPGALDFLKARVASSPDIRQFSLRSAGVLSTHGHTMARMESFLTSGLGKKLVAETDVLRKSGNAGAIMAHSMDNTFLPGLLGRKSIPEAMQGFEWGGIQNASLNWLQTQSQAAGPAGKFAGKMRDLLLKNGSVRPGSATAAYFFHTTLGLNPASAVLNLTQNFTTTANILGPRVTAEAMAKVSQKFTPLLKTLDRTKIDDVLANEFPDFIKSGLNPTPYVEEVLQLSREIKSTAGSPNFARRAFSKAKDVSMFMFQRSELWNRLVAFEAGRMKWVRDGAKVFEGKTGAAARIGFAKRITETTQFAGDPLLTLPEALQDITPALRQFLTFGTRFAEFVGSTAGALGSGAKSIGGNIPFVSGRNPGTLGRLALGYGLVSEGSRQFLGTDLTRFSAGGAIPTSSGFGAFPALPLVPPVVSVAGALAVDFARDGGPGKETSRIVPLLIPGGIEATRLGAIGVPGLQALTRFVGRSTANYQEVGPDGKVDVFGPSGGLEARLTPFQLYARAAGLPVGDLQATQELRDRIRKVAPAARQAKALYLTAVLNNDMGTAQQLAEQFQASFGVPLQVKPADIRRERKRRSTPRLLREIKRMPREVQEGFLNAMRILEAQTGANDLTGSELQPAPLQPAQAFGQGRPTGAGPSGGGSLGRRGGQQGPPQTRSIDLGTLAGQPNTGRR